MHQTLGTVELKSGEAMQIVRVTAPDDEWKDRVLPLLGHKGQPWQWQMKIAFEEELEGLQQHFYVGALDSGEIAGNIMTVEGMEPPIGILGHVFTPPEHRRKGICSHLMEAVTEDFRGRSGRALFLHTDYDSPPYHIYASWGFEGYRETGTMAWLLEEDFWSKQFAARPVSVRETRWEDWPGLEALAEVDEGWHVRSLYLDLHGFGGFESAYLRVRRGLEDGLVRDFRVLAAEDGAVMGYALLGRWGAFPGDPQVLDIHLHPNFEDHAFELAGAVDLPDNESERVIAMADSASSGKSEALEAVGLVPEARLAEMVVDADGSARDLLIFSLG